MEENHFNDNGLEGSTCIQLCLLRNNDMNVVVNCTHDPSTHMLSQLPLVQSRRECNYIILYIHIYI